LTPEQRIEQISAGLESIRGGWPFLSQLFKEEAERLTVELIGQDNEQTRGRIKQLRELMELPLTLHSEREAIRAGLIENDPGNL
jgi:hypothetical protein